MLLPTDLVRLEATVREVRLNVVTTEDLTGVLATLAGCVANLCADSIRKDGVIKKLRTRVNDVARKQKEFKDRLEQRWKVKKEKIRRDKKLREEKENKKLREEKEKEDEDASWVVREEEGGAHAKKTCKEKEDEGGACAENISSKIISEIISSDEEEEDMRVMSEIEKSLGNFAGDTSEGPTIMQSMYSAGGRGRPDSPPLLPPVKILRAESSIKSYEDQQARKYSAHCQEHEAKPAVHPIDQGEMQGVIEEVRSQLPDMIQGKYV